eukprot:scaffold125864_cov18-Tisochrysis_lutea.AAC.1
MSTEVHHVSKAQWESVGIVLQLSAWLLLEVAKANKRMTGMCNQTSGQQRQHPSCPARTLTINSMLLDSKASTAATALGSWQPPPSSARTLTMNSMPLDSRFAAAAAASGSCAAFSLSILRAISATVRPASISLICDWMPPTCSLISACWWASSCNSRAGWRADAVNVRQPFSHRVSGHRPAPCNPSAVHMQAHGADTPGLLCMCEAIGTTRRTFPISQNIGLWALLSSPSDSHLLLRMCKAIRGTWRTLSCDQLWVERV